MSSIKIPSEINPVKYLFNRIDKSIDNTGKQSKLIAQEFGRQLQLTIESWEAANSKLLDKTFAELDEEHQKFFRNVNSNIDRLINLEDSLAEDIKLSLEQIQQVVADLKIWNNQPAILRYYPSILIPDGNPKKVLIMRGVNLDSANPQVFLGKDEVELEIISLTKQQAEFLLPLDLLPKDAQTIENIALRVKLEQNSNFLSGIWNSKISKQQNHYIRVLPRQLAKVECKFEIEKTEKEYTEYFSREFHHNSGDSLSGNYKCKTLTQDRKSNYRKIDIKTIEVSPEKSPNPWGKKGKHELVEKTPNKFSVKVCAKCRSRVPHRSGYHHVIYRWKEYEEKLIPENRNIESTQLLWLKDQVLDLKNYMSSNEKVVSFSVKLYLFDGQERIEIGEGFETEKYYNLIWDKSGKKIIIKPCIPKNLKSFIGF